jgi:hypothetical protein
MAPANILKAAVLGITLSASAAAAGVTPFLSINQLTGAQISACTSSLDVAASAVAALPGTATYNWTLYLNGFPIRTKSESITCNIGTSCPPPSFNSAEQAISGNYRIRLKVGTSDEYSNQIHVAMSGAPTPMSRINGNAATNVSVLDDGPMMLDFAGSACASQYFLSIELSDQNWNRLGGEFAKWLADSDYERYWRGKSFNLQAWAEDHGFRFVAGQYYRVKLAVAPPWNERSQLMHIMPYGHGPGEVRIRHKASGKCFYVDTNSAQSVRNWTCWAMQTWRFSSIPLEMEMFGFGIRKQGNASMVCQSMEGRLRVGDVGRIRIWNFT